MGGESRSVWRDQISRKRSESFAGDLRSRRLVSIICGRAGGPTVSGVHAVNTQRFGSSKPDRFLIDIVLVALLKGHLQGNKGYQLEVFDNLE